MKFEMNYQNQTILVDNIKVETSGVLFATIVAVQDENSCVFIKTDSPRKIIISGSYALEECNANVYDSVESYEEALMEEFEL